MLNQDQYELLQSFVTMPDPSYAEMFALQAEIEDLTDQLEVKSSEFESLQDDLKDSESEKDDQAGRINELECALADALAIISGDVIPSDFAETDKEFARLYKIL